MVHRRQHLDFRDLPLADVTAVAVPPRPEDPWDFYGKLVGKYQSLGCYGISKRLSNVQKPVDIPLNWLVNRDFYGLLQSPYKGVVYPYIPSLQQITRVLASARLRFSIPSVLVKLYKPTKGSTQSNSRG